LTVLRKQASRCTFVKGNGDPCRGYRLTRAGVRKMLDGNFDLVADPERFCAYHARSESERYEMSVRGGSYSPKRVRAEREAERKQVEQQMPRDIVLAGYALIRQLIAAKLPTMPPEPDVRRVALGVYLSSVLCARPTTGRGSRTRCCRVIFVPATTSQRSRRPSYRPRSTSWNRRSNRRCGRCWRPPEIACEPKAP
jgi:hypothetical protein